MRKVTLNNFLFFLLKKYNHTFVIKSMQNFRGLLRSRGFKLCSCFLVVCVTCLRLQTYSTSHETKIELHPDSSRAPFSGPAISRLQTEFASESCLATRHRRVSPRTPMSSLGFGVYLKTEQT